MDTNLAHCPSDDVQSDLIQWAQPLPDANRLSGASNDVDFEVFELPQPPDSNNGNVLDDENGTQPKTPFSNNDTQ